MGKFLTLLDENSTIVKQGESPDFIILFEENKIGLEHQRIFKLGEVEFIHSVKKLFDDAAMLFRKEHPEIKILANCWLTASDFKFTKAESTNLKKEIADFIYCIVTKQKTLRPKYISRVLIMPHTDVDFEFNSGGFVVEYIDDEFLKSAIEKKEKLVSSYIKKSNLKQQWLLLVIGDVGPHSFRFRLEQITPIESSKFDRIYLMEDFDGKVWRLF